MKLILIAAIVAIVLPAFTAAHLGDASTEAEMLIESKVACDILNDAQLESIGDYYMGQMHPGEFHEAMDSHMGGEGSEPLRQMHISMAKSLYCGNETAMPAGMMNMMMDADGHGMKRGSAAAGGMGYGVMNYGTLNSWNLNGSLLTLLLLLLIALAIIIMARLLGSSVATRGKETAARRRTRNNRR
jgi:hypothetical protein